MSVLEQNRSEIRSYLNSWKNTSPEQFVEELASLNHETNGIPDPFHYLISAQGELLSPSGQCRVKDTIYDKTSHIGRLEYQATLAIENWAAQNNEGAIVWISPPEPGVYPVTKIMVSELEDEGKKLFNRAILFNFDGPKCLEIANYLAKPDSGSPAFVSIDQLRSTPLALSVKQGGWIGIFENLIDDPALWEMIRQDEDKIIKQKSLAQAAIIQQQVFAGSKVTNSIDSESAVMQMIGPKPGSCPPQVSLGGATALQVFSENALTYSSSGLKDPDFCKNCPVCGKAINCVVRMGGSCPECGAVKKCG